MEHSGILRDLIVLYGMAMAIAFLLRKAKQPTMIGYLITGVLAGPYALRLISDTQAVELLAQVGVALLLFTIGLELSLKKLARMQQVALAAGSLQLFAAVLATAGLLLGMGFSIREALFWGFLVALSSTAVVLKVLHDRGELDTLHGRAVLGIQLFQDLCVVPMMALLPTLAAPGSGQALRVLAALGKSLLIVGAILVLARYLFPPLLRAIVLVRSRELFVIASIFFVLGTAWGATRFGLSLALGAFLAGIVLSESEYGHQIMAEILPFRDGFTSLFFISVGMLIDLRSVIAHAGVLTTVVVAILLGKFLLGGASIAVLGFPLRMAALVSLALAQVGEFSFVLLSEGFRLGLISTERYQIFLAAAVLTMMVTPGFIAASPRVAQWLGQKGERRRSRLAPDETTERLRDHVILCGYGLNGRRMARLLREYHLPYVIIEMNPRLVRQARAEGEPIYFGDASNPQILKAAGADHARAIVFAISDPSVLARAISHARLRNPDLHIIARIKRIEDARELRHAGATDVIAEELEAWMEIAVRVLRLYGMPREAVAELIGHLRAEDYDMVRILPIPGQPLRHLAHLLPEVDIELFIVLPGSPLVGAELRQVELRQRTGVNVLAVIRDPQVVHNPPGEFRIQEGDQLILIGSRRQLQAAYDILSAPPAGTVAERPDAARGE